MPLRSVSDLRKTYGDVSAVDGVSFSADEGELLCLLGPSGCGKTTMLRVLAGLDEPDSGTITFDGRGINHLPPQERDFGLMFQDLALFPHMDVFSNVAFGLRMQKLPSSQVEKRVEELLALVELGDYSHRKVHELSGGERQRVALVRSLAPAPKLLMFDEPLGSLDRALRESLQSQVHKILKEVGLTSIYVTHDRDEAFTMADRLIFMNHGQIIQTGSPEETISAPADGFVARTLGFKNILAGVVLEDGPMLKLDCPIGVISANKRPGINTPRGSVQTILIDEKTVSVSNDSTNEINSFQGVITERVFRGYHYELRVKINGGELYCHAPLESREVPSEINQPVSICVDAPSIRFLDSDE